MKATQLLTELKPVIRCTNNGDTTDLFSCLFIEQDVVKASNGWMFLRKQLPESLGVNAACCAKVMLSLLSNASDDEVVLKQNEKTLTCKIGDVRARLDIRQSDNTSLSISAIKEPPAEAYKPLPPDLLPAVMRVEFSCLTDKIVNPLCGVYVNGGYAYSTDRFRLTRVQVSDIGESLLILNYVLKELKQHLAVLRYFCLFDNKMYLTDESRSLVLAFALMAKQYPDLSSWFPAPDDRPFFTWTPDLIERLKKHLMVQRAKSINERMIKLSFNGDALVLASSSARFIDMEETVPLEYDQYFTGTTVTVNPLYLVQAVSACPRMALAPELKALMFSDGQFTHMLKPK